MWKIFFALILPLSFSSNLVATDSSALREGKKAFSRKAYGEAIKQFTKHSEGNPQDGESQMYMGYIYEYKKDYPKSISHFRKAAELDLDKDQRKTVLLKLALFFNYHQDWNSAASYSARYLKYDPKNEEVQKIYNRAIGNRGNPSYSYSPPVQKQEPKQTSTKQEPKSSKKDTEEPDDDDKLSSNKKIDYEQELSTNPNLEDLRWEYVLILFDEKNYDLAETNLKFLLEKNPGRSRYHYKMGILQLRKENPEKALESFERAKKNPFSKDTKVFLYYVYLNEGVAYSKLGQYQKAEEAYKNAFSQVNKDTPQLALAKMYLTTGDWEKCNSSAEKAMLLNPNPIEAHMYRFFCSYEIGTKDKKFENSFLKYASFIDTNFPNLEKVSEKYQLGFIKLARRFTEMGQYPKAESFFSQVANDEMAKSNREFAFYRGRNYFYWEQWDNTISQIQNLENDAQAQYLLARTYTKKKDPTKAMFHLERAFQLKPNYWKAKTVERDFKILGNDKQFQDFLSKVIALEPPKEENP